MLKYKKENENDIVLFHDEFGGEQDDLIISSYWQGYKTGYEKAKKEILDGIYNEEESKQ